jgi:hypothetical protein
MSHAVLMELETPWEKLQAEKKYRCSKLRREWQAGYQGWLSAVCGQKNAIASKSPYHKHGIFRTANCELLPFLLIAEQYREARCLRLRAMHLSHGALQRDLTQLDNSLRELRLTCCNLNPGKAVWNSQTKTQYAKLLSGMYEINGRK